MVNWDIISKDYHNISTISVAYRSKISKLAELVVASRAKRVLDVGCGTGVLEHELAEKHFSGTIIGLDSSAGMLKIAQELNSTSPNTLFRQSDLNRPLPFKDDYFDLTTSINVIFCLRNQLDHLRELYRVTINGGRLILVSPKPVADNFIFVKEQVKGKGLGLRVIELAKLIYYLPSVVRLLTFEKKISRELSGRSQPYPSEKEISRMLIEAGFRIDRVDQIQAGQNLLFLASKNFYH